MTNDEMNEGGPCDGTWLDAMVVVMDSACTIGIRGTREIGKAKNIRKGAEVNIRTANGVVKADKVGDLYTEQGVLTGYLVEESEYTLWPVEYEVQKHNAEYR